MLNTVLDHSSFLPYADCFLVLVTVTPVIYFLMLADIRCQH